MSDVMSPPNPSAPPDVWQFPATYEKSDATLDEEAQQQYVEYLASPAGEPSGHETDTANEGSDPFHAEVVQTAAAEALAHATSWEKQSHSPEIAAPVAETPPAAINEVTLTPQDRLRNHNAATHQANMYAGRIEAMRNRGLMSINAEAERA